MNNIEYELARLDKQRVHAWEKISAIVADMNALTVWERKEALEYIKDALEVLPEHLQQDIRNFNGAVPYRETIDADDYFTELQMPARLQNIAGAIAAEAQQHAAAHTAQLHAKCPARRKVGFGCDGDIAGFI